MKTINDKAQLEIETLFDEMIVEKLSVKIEEIKSDMSEVNQQQSKLLNAINMNVNAIKTENKKIIPEMEDLYENLKSELLNKADFESFLNDQKIQMDMKMKKLILRLNILIGFAIIICVGVFLI